jgi:aminoglycoside/choline kinase family phosphotransferase
MSEYNEDSDESIIIMEDLSASGYIMSDKSKSTNYEQAKLLVTTLGKLHAVSFAMKEQKLEVYKNFQHLGDFMSDNFLGMLMANMDESVKTLDEKDVDKKTRFLKLKDGLRQLMADLVDPKLCEPYAIVTHGDCWSNNLMYQYKVSVMRV